MTPDVKVCLADLPCSIKAYTLVNSDGTYNIILNARHSHHQHLLSYHHEMQHIEKGDYERQTTADLIELFAHA